MRTKKGVYIFWITCTLACLCVIIGLFLSLSSKPKAIFHTLCHEAKNVSFFLCNENQDYIFGARSAFQVSHQSPFFTLDGPWGHTVIDHQKICLSAVTGIFHHKKSQAYLCHRVIADCNHGEHMITTQKALVDGKKKSISCKTLVKGRGAYGHFQSQGLNLRKNTLRLRGPVSMTIKTY
jgi:hypothetical protein